METDVLERIKQEIAKLQGMELGAISIQRAKVLVGVNAPDKKKARRILSSPEFANAIQATVTQLRKTQATGFSVQVDDPAYGKPIIIRIRSGGTMAGGVKNEHDLVSTLDSAIQNGYTNILFKDTFGGRILVKAATSIRNTGSDPGSRMGNRGDIEIADAKGGLHRFSLKKENASGVAGLTRFLAKSRLKTQRSLRDFILNNNSAIHPKGYVSVRITQPDFYRFCWFGKDIHENGGVLVGNFTDTGRFSYDDTKAMVTILCRKVFSPKDDFKELMTGDMTSAYLMMKVNQRTYHMDFLGAYNKRMAGIYELPGFEIPGVNAPATAPLSAVAESDDWDEVNGPYDMDQAPQYDDSTRVTLTLRQLRSLLDLAR